MSEIIDLTTGNFGYGFSDDYKQGYSDGRASIVKELEDIKEEIYRHHNITCNLKCATCFLEYNCELRRKIDLLEDLKIIDKHISELKGENNE